ncbi:hypothetical protein KKI24_14310 [bacterium]|nr:hypothetical protein [bacterium]
MDFKLKQVFDSNGNFSYHDIYFTDGYLEVVEGINEIANRIICGLSVYRGENFVDPSYGVDYHNNVFGREETDPVVIDSLKAAILETRGVTGIKSFELTRAEGTRTANLEAQVETTAGEVALVTPIYI